MKIEVFKSEFTGELFENENDYKNHLKEYKKKQEKEKEKEITWSHQEKIKNEPRLTATSLEDYRAKVFDAIQKLHVSSNSKLLSLEFSNVRFNESVSNSHSAPIGCQTNFSKIAGLPTSYPGWNGWITLVFSKEEGFGGDLYSVINCFPGINLGSGGYRGSEYKEIKGYVLGFELRLYLQDFPILQKQYDEYLELSKKMHLWESEITKMINIKNSSDDRLISIKKNIDVLCEKIEKLHAEKNDLYRQSSLIESENRKEILEKNEFNKTESDRLKFIASIF